MATKYFPVGYGRTYDSSKNYTEQQLRDLATTPTGEYNEGIYNTVKSFEQEKTETQVLGVTPSINVVGQDSKPYQGSSGGKGSPSINISTPSINIPTPNLDQDFKAPVVEAVQAINVPRPNLDQDFTKGNMADVQEAVVDAGSAVQAQVVESGGAGQQALIDAASATQTNAIVLGTNLTGGQSNPALEQEASNITKGVEGSIATETKGLESSIQTEVKGYEATVAKEVKGLEASLAKEVKGVEAIPTDFANWNIDFAQKFDQSLDKDEDTYSSTTTPMPSANLDAKEATGNEAVFGDIETSTTKADKLTEEERLRRIRRLMLNRYGREDTILTGAKDPMNRRRYASAL
jgi:hypothetical protein